MTIETKPYLLRMTIDLIYYYVILFGLRPRITGAQKAWMLALFLPLTFFLRLFGQFADILLVVISYFVLAGFRRFQRVTLNETVLSVLIKYLTSLTISVLTYFVAEMDTLKSYPFVLAQLAGQLALILLILRVANHFEVAQFVQENSSALSSALLIYLFLVALLLDYAARYYRAFDRFIVGITAFLLVQSAFIALVFIRSRTKQTKKYQDQLLQQELASLRRYTDSLERQDHDLAVFRHDYKNLLLSLKASAATDNAGALLTQIAGLEDYSEQFFHERRFNYQSCHNVHNSYLKSLIIAKLSVANAQKIAFQVECQEPLTELPLPIFDGVRLLGILLDNAIEAAAVSEARQVRLLLYQDQQQIEFLVENSCAATPLSSEKLTATGYSTKPGHPGLGLANVQAIQRKYDNVFVQYQQQQGQFTTQVILMK